MAVSKTQVTRDSTTAELTGCLPLLVRLTWMMIGNLVLILCAALVAQGRMPGTMDVIYFGLAAGLVAVRYLDVSKLNGRTVDGQRATRADWRRYSIKLAGFAVVLWLLARLVEARGWL